jgi:hypothetical protein
MSEFAEVERKEIAVQFVRVPIGRTRSDAPGASSRTWLRSAGGTSMARSIPSRTSTAPASRCDQDDLAGGLESGTLPGGRYRRARLRGDAPEIYERIKPTFDALAAQHAPDETRPSLEHHRRHDEIDLLLPI